LAGPPGLDFAIDPVLVVIDFPRFNLGDFRDRFHLKNKIALGYKAIIFSFDQTTRDCRKNWGIRTSVLCEELVKARHIIRLNFCLVGDEKQSLPLACPIRYCRSVSIRFHSYSYCYPFSTITVQLRHKMTERDRR
jgi:hypothetical protein